jgi:hypothetical protein
MIKVRLEVNNNMLTDYQMSLGFVLSNNSKFFFEQISVVIVIYSEEGSKMEIKKEIEAFNPNTERMISVPVIKFKSGAIKYSVQISAICLTFIDRNIDSFVLEQSNCRLDDRKAIAAERTDAFGSFKRNLLKTGVKEIGFFMSVIDRSREEWHELVRK